jgi:superfamily II DNA or RNA helicase
MTLRRGTAYVRRGAVGPRRVESGNGVLVVEAEVDEGALAPVQVRLNWDGRELIAVCTCPMQAPCKHAMAVAMAHLESPGDAEVAVASAADATVPRLRPGDEVLFYNLHVAPPPKRMEKQYRRGAAVWLSMERAIVMDDGLPGMPRPLALWGPVPRRGLSAADQAILDVIEPYYRARNRDFSSPHAHGIPLLDEMVAGVFNELTRCPFVFGAGRTPIEVRPDCVIRSVGGPYELIWDIDGELVAGQVARLVGEDPGWLLVRDVFRPVLAATVPDAAVPLVDAPEDNLVSLVLHEAVEPVLRLNLSEEDDRLLVRVNFRYGNAAPLAPGDSRQAIRGEAGGVWGHWPRDIERERAWFERLNQTLLESRGSGQFMVWGEEALIFLMDELPQLLREGAEVYGEERLDRMRVRRQTAYVSVGVSSGIDWFDLQTTVQVEDETVSWQALRDAFKRNSRFVKLGDGAYARLPEEWLVRQQQLAAVAGARMEADEAGFTQRLPRYLAPAARELMESAGATRGDQDWRRFLDGLDVADADRELPPPAGFIGELRHYQGRGLARLGFWRDYGLHGILADDMGLGKTIQAIALLLEHKASGNPGPSLLVAPTSVVYNWESEIARFAPDIKVLVLHGSDRHERLDALAEADVVVTTYGLLQRDRHIWHAQSFAYVILDEAQKIKNPHSQAAKAACRLYARHRLCLTGTPIENNLLEFWSLFHFLMPGLLGSEKHFRSQYFKAVSTEADEARERLRRITRPFILRRLKSDVATDLPPRSEIVAYCELGDEQRRLYNETLAAVRGQIFSEVQTKGLKRAHFHVLEGLLRLRQVACDPLLVQREGAKPVPSAKVTQFLELLGDMIEQGHRVLVFSQFVKMLHILRDALSEQGIDYAYLDGQTRDRLERVNRFNEGDTPVFLISLKAGGTGLNLTGADYVIHFDPWWNPAVEDQATDRAHRIGQTRHVFSYKLIAKGTVEEKVLQLQAQKRKMVRDVLGASEGGPELTMADLEFLLE